MKRKGRSTGFWIDGGHGVHHSLFPFVFMSVFPQCFNYTSSNIIFWLVLFVLFSVTLRQFSAPCGDDTFEEEKRGDVGLGDGIEENSDSCSQESFCVGEFQNFDVSFMSSEDDVAILRVNVPGDNSTSVTLVQEHNHHKFSCGRTYPFRNLQLSKDLPSSEQLNCEIIQSPCTLVSVAVDPVQGDWRSMAIPMSRLRFKKS